MRLKGKVWAAAICVAVAATMSSANGATRPGVVSAAYAGLPVTPPTPDIIFVCHGFGCKYRVEFDLTGNDRAKLVLAAGRSSATAERKAVAAARAWFDRRVGPVAGTLNPVARAGMKYMYDVHQY